MTEPKPSGIRPPSKIGRPCCTVPPRPAVPPSPPRPGMNTSVVLTEDTDSFIIGDRVWVGGTKPGSIAYIGETQFAPGDWAGVVLDEPIGKNDGSVAGCRYFQCEPKRGIFSRLTRLTRQPLADLSATQKTPTTSPENTKGSLNKSMSPSLNASTTSLSSTISQRDLKIGERVIVSSSQGSKTGVLRYLGTTEFAPGEWCGIELDESIGKNDGSVADKRYFECRPKYGLFAPIHKVSRSPSSKRSSCVVHKPTGAALNSSLRKAGSRESLLSVSSIASTTASTATAARATGITRESLKEKQQEIEMLRKERDLERERVTKAASQADQAEQSALSIKKEYEKYREEMQKTVSETESALAKVLEEKNALLLQLEEEKRKCEDLLFRFEEESVNKDDIKRERTEQSVINTVNENRIKDLEKQILEERQRVAQLEQDSIKLFETEEELTRLRNEFASNAAQDKTRLEELQSENKSLEEAKSALERVVDEKSALVEQCVAHIKELEAQLEQKEKERNQQKATESDLQNAIENIRQTLEEKCKLIEHMRKEYEDTTNSLKEELQRAKEIIESLKKEGENERESLKAKYEKIMADKENLALEKSQILESESQKKLEMQNLALEELKAENMKKINELSASFNQELSMKDSKIVEVSQQLNEKISETEKLMVELNAQLSLTKKKDEELLIALRKLDEINSRLKVSEENNVCLSKQIQDYETKSEASFKILKEKQQLEQQLTTLIKTEGDSAEQLAKLSEELKAKDKELVELRATTAAQIEELTKRFQVQMEEKSKHIDEINTDVAHKSELLSKLEKDISELRSIIVSKDQQIKHLEEKTLELQAALTLAEKTKTNMENNINTFEKNIEQLNQQIALAENKISQITTQKEKLELDIKNVISTSADSSEQLVKYNEELRMKEKELDELKEKTFKAESLLKSTENKLTTTGEELKKNVIVVQQQQTQIESFGSLLEEEKRLNSTLTDKLNQYETQNQELSKQIEEHKNVKRCLTEKSEEISKLLIEVENGNKRVTDLQKQCDDLQKSQLEHLASHEKEVATLKSEVDTSQEEIKTLQKAKAKFEADQSANRWNIEELTEKLTAEEGKRKSIETLLSERELKLQETENKISELEQTNQLLMSNKENTNKDLVNVASANKDLTTSLNNMTNTVEELKTKLTVATEDLKVKDDTLRQMKNSVEESQNQISQLNSALELTKEEQVRHVVALKEAQDALATREHEMNEIRKTNTTLADQVETFKTQLSAITEKLNTKENLLLDMEGTVKELRNSSDESIIKLQSALESEVRNKQSEIDGISKEKSDIEKKLQSLEHIVNKQNDDLNAKNDYITKLTAQMKSLEDAQTEKVKADQQSRNEQLKLMQDQAEDINRHNMNLIETNASLEKLVKDYESRIEVLTNTARNKEKETEKNMQNLIEKLNIVSSESVKLKEAQSTLEKENKQITSKWNEATNELKLTRENVKNNYDAAGGDMKQHIVDKDIDLLKLREQYETAKNQVEFLNSVIVDMQRKNETLLCKVEVLEMGVPPNEADDYSRATLEKRVAAPRMFCDICDQFDLHETEDCPRQAQDFLEPEKITKSPKKASVERPYCENCEMFGHDTRDCDDAETF